MFQNDGFEVFSATAEDPQRCGEKNSRTGSDKEHQKNYQREVKGALGHTYPIK
jgi:hypothetical protein